MQSFLNQIGNRLDSLSRAESRVATWVLANPGQTVNASIQTVAAWSEVSEPTVIRFCRSMGLQGFRELKTQLITALQRSESYLHHDVEVDDTPASAAVKVLESSVNALIDLRKQMATMPFDPAVQTIIRARQIIFAGLGASGHVAGDACHKFFRLGIPAVAATDSPTILQLASVCQPADVLIGISHTGKWKAMIEGIRIARSRGVEVIALTDPGSALAGEASILFPCHPDEDTNLYTPMSSRLAQLTVLDALQVSVALQMGQVAEANLRSAKAALTLRSEESML